MIVQIDGEYVVFGSTWHPKMFLYCYDVKLVTVEDPLFQKRFYIEPFACLNGSSHGEMVARIKGEYVVFGSLEHQEGLLYCYDVKLVTIEEPYLQKVLYRTMYKTFCIDLKNNFAMQTTI